MASEITGEGCWATFDIANTSKFPIKIQHANLDSGMFYDGCEYALIWQYCYP